MLKKPVSDLILAIGGFILGIVIQETTIFFSGFDPIHPLLFYVLLGLPALIMTLIRPRKVWIWWISSSLVLPMILVRMNLNHLLEEFRFVFIQFVSLFLRAGITAIVAIVIGILIRRYFPRTGLNT